MSERITDYDDAVDYFFEHLHDFTKSELKHTQREDLICYHLTLGQSVRNMFNLWQNPDLVVSTGCSHPDEASYKIIIGVWKRLQQDPNVLTLKNAPEPIQSSQASQNKALQKYMEAMGDVISLE